MATVANVEARFTADTNNFVAGMRQAQKAAQSVGQQVQATSQQAERASDGFTLLKGAMATAFGVGAVDLIKGAFGAVKGFAMESMHAAARVEELDIAMTAIGESTGIGYAAIKEATKAIRDNGIEIGAAQQIAIEFAQNQLDMAAASKVARVAQDLAVIGGKNSTETTMLLTRAIITGQSELLKSAGISRTAGEAYQELAASLQVSESALTSTQKQQAVVNLILSEGEKVAGTYEAAMNSAGKVLRSFPRLFNDIKVEVGGVMTEAFGPIIKATYDLVKAFSYSVREGGSLSGTLQSLTAAMVQVTEPMVDMIHYFTELVKSGELFGKVNEIVQTGVPLMLALSDVTSQFAKSLLALLVPALENLLDGIASFLKFITPMVEWLASLPQVVKLAVGALLLLRTAIGASLVQALAAANVAIVGFRARIMAAFASARVSAISFTITIKEAMIAARTQMGAIVAAARVMGAGVVGAFRAIGVAAKGLMASLGPVGWALMGVAVAFEVFSGKSAQAEALVGQLKDTVDETTGAFTELTDAAIGTQFRIDLSAEDQTALAEMGLSVDAATAALMEGGDAAEAFNQKIQTAIDSSAGTTRDLLITWQRNYQGMMDATVETARVVEAEAQAKAEAEYRAAMATQAAAEQSRSAARGEAQERRAAQAELVASYSETARANLDYRDSVVRNHGLIDEALNATVEATRAVKDAFLDLQGILDASAAEDRMAVSLQKLKDSFKDVEASAADNRDAIRNYMRDAMSFADTMDNPVEKLAVMEDALGKVEKQMKGQEIDPKTSKLYKDMKGAVEAAQDEVENMDTAVENAERAGLDVTLAIAEGIKQGMEDEADAIETAGKAGGAALIDGMNAGAGVNSPSTFAITAGKMVGVGMAQGVAAMSTPVNLAGFSVGANLIAGMKNALDAGVGPIAAAVRRVVAAAIAAAKDESDQASPSKVFYKIGDNLIEGLKLGWLAKSGSFVEDVARTVQAAIFAFEDAKDRVKEAKKALKEVREEQSKGKATAREVAAAQRALTMALWEQADAAKAAKEAQRNLKAEQKLAKMKPTNIKDIKKSMRESIKEDGTFGTAWEDMSRVLYNRARRAGMTREAAQAYVDSVMGQVEQQFEKELLRVQKLQKKLAEVRKEIAETEAWQAARTDAADAIKKTFESRFGQDSDFKKAYDSTALTIDRAIDLFDRLSKMIEQRLVAKDDDLDPDAGERTALIQFLEAETQKLVDLIKKRDDLMEQFAKADADYNAKVKEKQDAEKRLTESLLGFTKISGRVSSADEYIIGLQQRVAATKTYISDIEALRKRGLSEAVIEQILAAGPESGGSFAAALAQATDEQLKYVNELTGQTQTMAEEFGQTQASVMYDAGVASAKALRDGLQTQIGEVTGQIDAIVAGIEERLAPLAESGATAGDILIDSTLEQLNKREADLIAAIQKIGEEIAAAWEKAMAPVNAGTPSDEPASGGPKPGGNKNRRSAYVPASTPQVSASSSAINVAAGGVQVSVSVGSGSNVGVEDAVKSAVMDALGQVAAQAAGARR